MRLQITYELFQTVITHAWHVSKENQFAIHASKLFQDFNFSNKKQHVFHNAIETMSIYPTLVKNALKDVLRVRLQTDNSARNVMEQISLFFWMGIAKALVLTLFMEI